MIQTPFQIILAAWLCLTAENIADCPSLCARPATQLPAKPFEDLKNLTFDVATQNNRILQQTRSQSISRRELTRTSKLFPETESWPSPILSDLFLPANSDASSKLRINKVSCATPTAKLPSSDPQHVEVAIASTAVQEKAEAKAQETEQEALQLDDRELDGREGRELLLRNFRPNSELKVKQSGLTQAKFPVIDVHTHFRHRLKHSKEELTAFLEVMDRNQIAICVSLDGQLGAELESHQAYLLTDHPNRFLIFANIGWIGDGDRQDPRTWACQREDFVRQTIFQLREAKEAGVSGVKIFKQFGLGYRDAAGNLLKIDDPRWDPIWKVCGELGLPIIIHTADPAAFFKPIDETNERWEELSRHPDWSFYGDEFPSREELLDARNRVIKRHPNTIFIGAHVANNAEDLQVVQEWLDEYPNLYIGFASRISELGRQPYTARKFFIDHQDRILFSTDGPWPETRLRYYWRFLETFDENFPYSEKEFPPQGLWNIYGIGLPDEVLRKIYFENACRILPRARQTYANYLESRQP